MTAGLLNRLGAGIGEDVSPEDLFAYTYGILAQPSFVKRFWDELELPPPRLPITTDHDLFFEVVDLGRRLLYLHTYSERFVGPDDDGRVSQGAARNTVPVPADEYPEDHAYDAATMVLRVGAGEFAPVAPEVYAYSVSGLQVVKSWLGYRKAKRAGRSSSELDNIRPERWSFAQELLELLWVLENTIELEPTGRELLDRVCASNLFSDIELPKPAEHERRPPGSAGPPVQSQLQLTD